MSFVVVIPARYHSSRLPAKPLADIHGKPMIQWVSERALQAGAERVVVATDDERIADQCTHQRMQLRLQRLPIVGVERDRDFHPRVSWLYRDRCGILGQARRPGIVACATVVSSRVEPGTCPTRCARVSAAPRRRLRPAASRATGTRRGRPPAADRRRRPRA